MRHELFLRMMDEDRLIPAGEFVLAAEEHGSIGEIDRWVVARAIDIAARGFPVHLNLSMRSTDPWLTSLIATRLQETVANPEDIVFELSEPQLVDAADQGAEFVRDVTDLGCRVALDNYVKGGNGTSFMRRYPLSYVKIGQPLIGELGSSAAQRRAVTSTVLRAHRYGQKVIAQGVETLLVLDTLVELGVDEAQGHAFGPAEPVEVALERLD